MSATSRPTAEARKPGLMAEGLSILSGHLGVGLNAE
jgi:hypothetical protein